MAKAKSLSVAIDRTFKDYEKALMTAMTYASENAEYEIGFKARSCLYEYYENFQPITGEPNIYERTDTLISSFVPYKDVSKTNDGNGVISSVGMGYDSSKLEGVYNGSKKWTPVDGSWVLENYLKGIHPTTDGSPFPGAEYIAVYDPESPTEKMEKFLNNYVKTFSKDVLISFVKQITRR